MASKNELLYQKSEGGYKDNFIPLDPVVEGSHESVDETPRERDQNVEPFVGYVERSPSSIKKIKNVCFCTLCCRRRIGVGL